MALAGFCISRSGIDIALVSAQDGVLQGSASKPLELIDPIAPDADALVVPFTSLASRQPTELIVLAISTQVWVAKRYDVLHKIGLSTDDRFTIDYIGAYVAGLKADEVASAPCLLFIEITPTIFIAQLVTIYLEGTKRIRVPVHVEAATFTSTTTLPTFIGRVFAWAQGHNHKLFQCILLDPPSGSVDVTALQIALASDCPISIVDGAQLAKYAASYAFLNLEDLRQPSEDDDMGQYAAPSPISFVVNNGPPTLIIHRSAALPAVRDIIFTTSEENQTSIAVEFAFGMHDARSDDRLIFAPRSLWKDSTQGRWIKDKSPFLCSFRTTGVMWLKCFKGTKERMRMCERLFTSLTLLKVPLTMWFNLYYHRFDIVANNISNLCDT
jgi:hypothetical protein